MKDKKAGEINKEVIKKITERKKEKEQQKAADYQKMIDVIMKKLGLDEKDVALASHCELTFRTTDKGTSIDYSVIEGKINGKKIEMEENAWENVYTCKIDGKDVGNDFAKKLWNKYVSIAQVQTRIADNKCLEDYMSDKAAQELLKVAQELLNLQ